MKCPIALLDACVLYPAPLRDLLMHLALLDLYRAKWTNMIHEEWIDSLLKKRPDLTRAALERTRDLMNAHVRDCLVEGYESHIPTLTLPDPDDRHVLAAAIHCEADVIVTFNERDFPATVLDEWGVKTQDPDMFVARLVDSFPDTVCIGVRRQRESLQNPPKTATELLEVFWRQGLTRTVERLKQSLDRL